MIHGFDTSFLVAHEVPCHADHAGVRARTDPLRAVGDGFGLTAQVLTEFVHIVSDPRRFSAPLSVEAALARAQAWWDSPGMQQIETGDDAVTWLVEAMTRHRLGRKRVLVTMLAATYRSAGIRSILTLNVADFEVSGEFTCLGPLIVASPWSSTHKFGDRARRDRDRRRGRCSRRAGAAWHSAVVFEVVQWRI